MENRLNLKWYDIQTRACQLAQGIEHYLHSEACLKDLKEIQMRTLYGIPRGGVFAVQAIYTELQKLGMLCCITEKENEADIFVDDIIDTGKTRDSYINSADGKVPFFALVDYQGRDKNLKGTWISFPWERMMNDDGPVENVRRLLEYIGEDPGRSGLKETPERVIKSFEKLYGGYKQKPEDVIKVFEDGCDEMVILKNVEFYSTCEHHMLPFYGKAHIAYIPKQKVIGVSKLARLLEIYSRRLQIQERICQQVTEAITNTLDPMGAACILEAQHFCMTSRGIEKQNSIMVTSSLTGVFRTNSSARQEFMSMIGK